MNRSIEQALSSLLPTESAALPQPLVDLASSLLAQSRLRSTLKAEEELARPYACAHIACDRLKTSLNLPPITECSPILPRHYKRLYNHLDKILPASPATARRGNTPSRRRLALASSPAARSRLSASTTPGRAADAPSREPGLTPSRHTTQSTPRPGTTDSGLPPWLRPTLRFLCRELGTPHFAPTIIAATDAIIVPHGLTTTDRWVHSNLPLLLGGLYLYLWRRMTCLDAVDPDQFAHARDEVVRTLNKARTRLGAQVADSGEGPGAWDGWHETQGADLDLALVEIHQRGWLDGDWARAINDLVDVQDAMYKSDAPSQDHLQLDHVQTQRGDIMIQDRYDLLSERRRRDFSVWKAKMLSRIASQEMDVD